MNHRSLLFASGALIAVLALAATSSVAAEPPLVVGPPHGEMAPRVEVVAPPAAVMLTLAAITLQDQDTSVAHDTTVADTGQTIPSPGTQLFSWLGMLLGSGAVALTALLKRLTQSTDSRANKIDSALTKLIKPIQPVIAAALGLVVPIANATFHLNLSSNLILQAPLYTLLSLSVLEAIKAIRKDD